jgi:hypothetical protein
MPRIFRLQGIGQALFEVVMMHEIKPKSPKLKRKCPYCFADLKSYSEACEDCEVTRKWKLWSSRGFMPHTLKERQKTDA